MADLLEYQDGERREPRPYLSEDAFRDSEEADGSDCPKCGWKNPIDYDRAEFIGMSKPEYNHGVAMEYGGQPHDWSELWQCPDCGCRFAFSNSDH